MQQPEYQMRMCVSALCGFGECIKAGPSFNVEEISQIKNQSHSPFGNKSFTTIQPPPKHADKDKLSCESAEPFQFVAFAKKRNPLPSG